VIEFYLGQRSLIEMHAAGRNSDDKCEAAFYTGEWEILRSDKAQAKASLQVQAVNVDARSPIAESRLRAR
jgi:hypothetical protein